MKKLKKIIIEMINQINDEKALKVIYQIVQKYFLK